MVLDLDLEEGQVGHGHGEGEGGVGPRGVEPVVLNVGAAKLVGGSSVVGVAANAGLN